MNRVQFISIAIGFVSGAAFKGMEVLSGSASGNHLASSPRDWLATFIFACLSGGASYVLARWNPDGSTKNP